jgi:DNA-directed RNA polymerase specialized sigma24 family protein
LGANVVNQQILEYLEEQSETFATRFTRCEGMLYFVACQILDTGERSDAAITCAVETAVNNCWHTASRNLEFFDDEGAFRSWLVRILFDQAVMLLAKCKAASPGAAAPDHPVLCN